MLRLHKPTGYHEPRQYHKPRYPYFLSNDKSTRTFKDGNNLFICDENVLKLYDASDINNLKLEAQEAIPETFDVITNNSIALVVAKDGLYQFDYSDIHNMRQLSKISIQ